MKSFACLPCLFAVLAAPAVSQESKPATPPPARRVPVSVVSPELASDGSVTFRYLAAKATSVKVQGQFGPETLMTKGENDVWSVTVPNCPGGVHEYRFVVDGQTVIDPRNSAIKPQRWPNTSILHVPSHLPATWDLRDVPHGVLHKHGYQSKALGKFREIVVYTPPREAAGPLPVLYLAHGFSDNEDTWTAHGKAHWIMDALIAEKKATPMIIVMPDAHALPPGPGYLDQYASQNTAAFAKEVIEDIIPLVERSYQVDARREARAFAGLSMGGHHALTLALNHHDTFGWIGAFSSAPPPTESVSAGLNAPDAVNGHLKLFWIACGKKDFLVERNETFTALLKEKGVKHEYEITEGDHSWPVWRRYLTDFTPKLFR